MALLSGEVVRYIHHELLPIFCPRLYVAYRIDVFILGSRFFSQLAADSLHSIARVRNEI